MYKILRVIYWAFKIRPCSILYDFTYLKSKYIAKLVTINKIIILVAVRDMVVSVWMASRKGGGRPRKADGIAESPGSRGAWGCGMQSESEGLRARSSWLGKLDAPAQKWSRERMWIIPSSASLFYSGLQNGRRQPICLGEGNPPYPVFEFKCWSHRETPSQTHPEIMFKQISGHLLIPSNCHIALNIASSRGMRV